MHFKVFFYFYLFLKSWRQIHSLKINNVSKILNRHAWKSASSFFEWITTPINFCHINKPLDMKNYRKRSNPIKDKDMVWTKWTQVWDNQKSNMICFTMMDTGHYCWTNVLPCEHRDQRLIQTKLPRTSIILTVL